MRKMAFALLVCAPVCPAVAAPAGTLGELFAQFGACIVAPSDSPEGEITLRFSLRRDGALIGRPHITFAKLPADPVKKNAVLQAAAEALGRCLPAKITDSLGGAIAGRPLILRLIARPPAHREQKAWRLKQSWASLVCVTPAKAG